MRGARQPARLRVGASAGPRLEVTEPPRFQFWSSCHQRAWGGRDPAVPRPPGSLWRDAPGPGSSGRPPSRAAVGVGVARVRPGDAKGDDATPVPRQDAWRPQLWGPGLHPKVNILCSTHKPMETRYFEGWCCQLFGTLSWKGAFSLLNNSGIIYFTFEYFFFFGTLSKMVPISS